MTAVMKKAFWLAGLLVFGFVMVQGPSADAASKCKSGYERIGGKCVKKCSKGYERIDGQCVKKCKKGQGRWDGKGKCVNLCKKGEIRNPDGKCVKVAFSPPICDDSAASFCSYKEVCEDNIWLDTWYCCSDYHFDEDNHCVPGTCGTEIEILGSCEF